MANNIHMKITGPDIAGEGTDGNHVGEIVIQSVQHGVGRGISSPGPGGQRESSNPSMGELTVTKLVDKATPKIAESACGSAGPHTDVKITFEKKSPNGAVVEYFVYKLKNVIVSSQNISGSDSGLPMESLSLNYDEITWEYTPTDPVSGDPQGVVPFGYSVSKNQKL